MVIRRGEIWWASLRTLRGSEPGFRRPIVVVQSDVFNESRIGTILAATITSNLRLEEAPGNFTLPKKESGLLKNSVVNVSQVVTLDRSFLIEKVGRIPAGRLHELDAGLRLVLSLE